MRYHGQMRILLQGAICLLFLCPLVGEQAQKVSISLGRGTVVPGERLALPVQISGVEEAEIVQLKLKVEFPQEVLEFVEARHALTQEKLLLETTLETGSDVNDAATVVIEGNSTQPLLPGDLLEIVFGASPEVYTDREVVIKNLGGSLTTSSGQELEGLEFQDGTVKIAVAAIVFGCFFYMH